MEWFNGGISEAVEKSKREHALFIVGVFGDSDDSKSLEESVNSEPFQTTLSATKSISIRLTAESQEHTQFKQIFPGADAPCLYFIAHFGAPVEIIQGFPSSDQVTERCGAAVSKHLASQGIKKPSNTTGESTQPSSAPPVGDASEPSQAEAGSSSPSVSLEDKLERARQLAAARAKLKAEEAAAEARQKEKERREAGRGMAELKRWQEEEETKRMMEERRREKREEQALRQKLREQIAQDRIERNRAQNEPVAATSASTPLSVQSNPPKNYDGKARLQFRMPNGSSQSHTFEKEVTLGFVRQFLIDGEHVKYRTFNLSLAYPRREFTATEYDMLLGDLGLLPSAALLVIPAGGLGSTAPSNGRFALWDWLSMIAGYVFYPLTWLMSNFGRALPAVGSGSGNSAPTPGQSNIVGGRNAGPRTESSGTSSSGAAARARKLDIQGSSNTSGNIHRLHTHDSDSDNEQGTWNGNSTQQKPK